jgi:DNA invertase Pin-like site-specific DNA recombinase
MGTNDNVKVAVYCRVGNEDQLAPVAGDKKTALYCRVALKDGEAVRNQVERLRRFAEEHGYPHPVCYIDNGVSGTTLNRPAMNRLIADIQAGAIKAVLVTNASRLARGYLPFSELLRLLEGTDIQCIAVDAGETGFSHEFAFWKDIHAHIAAESLKA